MPTIPAGLDPVVENYAIGAPDGVMRTEVAGGAPRYAMEWDRGVQQYRVTLILNTTRFSVWTTFFHHIIKKGALSFDMPLNSGYGMQTHSVSILPGSYAATPMGGGAYAMWTVSFTVETESSAYAMSSADALALLDLYAAAGDGSNALLDRINIFANRDTLVLGVVPAPAPAPSPAPPPAPAPGVPSITVANEVTDVLRVGNHMAHGNVWNAVALTRGVYTGLGGTTYEQQIGVAYPPAGSGGPIGMRIKWAFPTGSTEVKSFPSVITGNFPGWYQPSSEKAGGTYPIRLQDGSYSTEIPSGKTPGSFFPIALPIAGVLRAQGSWAHNTAPTGRWHLSYDIWLQSSASQGTGFTVPPIHTEVMIPLTYGGGYGAYVAGGGGRNPDWYWGDETIDGQLWHIFQTITATRKDGTTKGTNFNGEWNFLVYEPDSPTALPQDYQPNIALFLNFAHAKGWFGVAAPSNPNPATHVVSVELGVECVDGTGDLTFYNFDVLDV